MIAPSLHSILALLLLGSQLASAASPPLSPSELNDNPEKYAGRQVSVRGYFTLTPDAHGLYESRDLATEFRAKWRSEKGFDPRRYDKYCLTIANPGFLDNYRHSIDGKTFVVTGKFLDDYKNPHVLDMGACPLPTAILIDAKDFKHRYLRRSGPTTKSQK